MPGPSTYFFPKFISENLSGDARFQTTISARSSPQVRELASTQSIDFSFADFAEPVSQSPQYIADITSANCFCALHRDHRLATKTKITVSDLDAIPIGVLHDDHPLTQKMIRAFQDVGATFQSSIAAQFFLTLIPFISAGHCCSILDPLTVVTERELNIAKGQIVFRPFDAPIRYEYATLTPLHRPQSQLAMRIKDQWMKSLFDMLDDLGADPKTTRPS